MIKIFRSKFLLLIIITFFIVFYIITISQNKGVIEKKTKISNQNVLNNNLTSTLFKNVKYNYLDKKKNKYSLTGKEAIINLDKPDLIHLKFVLAETILDDNTLLKIISEEANFEKNKKDIFFSKNVKIKNKDLLITANNANYLYEKNIIEIFNNVILKNNKNIIKSDRLIYNLDKKSAELKMNPATKKQIYGKRKN